MSACSSLRMASQFLKAFHLHGMGYWPSEARRDTLTGDTEVLFERRSSPGYASELVQAGYLVSGGRARTETRTKFQDKIRIRLGGKRGGADITSRITLFLHSNGPPSQVSNT